MPANGRGALIMWRRRSDAFDRVLEQKPFADPSPARGQGASISREPTCAVTEVLQVRRWIARPQRGLVPSSADRTSIVNPPGA